MQTTLQRSWAYYLGWLAANASHIAVGSIAVAAANRYHLDTSVNAAEGCDVDELGTLGVAIRCAARLLPLLTTVLVQVSPLPSRRSVRANIQTNTESSRFCQVSRGSR